MTGQYFKQAFEEQKQKEEKQLRIHYARAVKRFLGVERLPRLSYRPRKVNIGNRLHRFPASFQFDGIEFLFDGRDLFFALLKCRECNQEFWSGPYKTAIGLGQDLSYGVTCHLHTQEERDE